MKLIKSLSRVAAYISSVTIGAMMFLTVTDVTMRYLFARPVTGSTEITEFMMVILILSVVPAAIAHRHISVDVLTERLTPKGQAFFDAIMLIASSWLVVVMGWRAFRACFFMISNDVRSPTLDIPIYPFYLVVALALLLLFVAMIALIVQRIAEVAKA
jgi:TRAP-type C4-dicarboxylate transport system permease small subunit